ncbi:MAG: PAS domain S-box protein, partial [Omnitrophica bacterium]|nr:PAS domain S-box protein [Candidatus Omnitrophota bacterium]
MKIADKISFSFFTVATLLTSITACISYINIKKNMQEIILAHLQTASQSRASHIKLFLTENKLRIRIIAEVDRIEDLTEKFYNEEANYENLTSKLNAALKDFFKQEKQAYELFILNRDGKIIASTDGSHLGLDKSSDAYFLGAIDKTYIKDPYYSESTKKRTFSISTPIMTNVTKEFLGVLVARFKMTGLAAITMDKTGLGQTGESYLINKYGYMITPSRFLKDTFLKQKVNIEGIREHSNSNDKNKHNHKHVSSSLGMYTIRDYRGVPVLGAYRNLEDLGWDLVVEIDTEEAFRSVEALKHILILIMIFVPIIAWALGIFVSKAITKSIVELNKGVIAVAKGELDHKVGIDTRDEIGQLSRAFDKMTGDLTKTTTSIEALNKEVSRRREVEEKAKQAAKKWQTTFDAIKDLISIQDKDYNLIQVNKAYENAFGMKQEELIGRKCYEFVHGIDKLISGCPHKKTMETNDYQCVEIFEPKMGIDIEVSMAPLRDDKGEITGTVHIIKDITERKEAEKEIRNLAKFSSENPNPVLRITKDGTIIYANKASLPLLNVWGCKIGRLLPEHLHQLILNVFDSGVKKDIDVVCGDSIFSLIFTPIVDAVYIYLFGLDISERKKIVEERETLIKRLEESQRLLKKQ